MMSIFFLTGSYPFGPLVFNQYFIVQDDCFSVTAGAHATGDISLGIERVGENRNNSILCKQLPSQVARK